MDKATNTTAGADDRAQEMKDRLDDYAALAVRICERRLSEEKPSLSAPLTVGEGSIRVDGERSKKQNLENTG